MCEHFSCALSLQWLDGLRRTPEETPTEPAQPHVWTWRAPWQRDEKNANLLTRRAAEACIRRWQVNHILGFRLAMINQLGSWKADSASSCKKLGS